MDAAIAETTGFYYNFTYDQFICYEVAGSMEVYDNSGNRITDDEGVATSFTVWVTPEEVERINTAVVYGGIQMYLKTK